jgi:glycosyltransferase involved in cell wall biosynthesis
VHHVVVMVATSYPRFPGDSVGSFMEPIAKGVAALGHEVHLVAPWHPRITRSAQEDGVHFHFFRYAPSRSLAVFGYAAGLREDTRLRAAAWAVAPAAVAAGWFKAWRVATKKRATVMHGHWVVPGGLIAAAAAGRRRLVVSLHGSDVFVAERHAVVRRAARAVFRRAARVTACSDDLRRRAVALGSAPARTTVVPYGVDTARFTPDADARASIRAELGIGDAPMVFAAGRLVSKKGFEFLIRATPRLTASRSDLQVLIAGDGDLRHALARQAQAAGATCVRFLGDQPQARIARLAAAADVITVPSIHDDAGNVDGLPNFALESMATATPLVATDVGGLGQLIEDGTTGRLVRERDPAALADTIGDLLSDPAGARRMGAAARRHVNAEFSWAHTARCFAAAYDDAGE